tara:strand:+ start:3553 stop:3912 length:360 start_codon:yes stop_codon:yes gene_type:complete
MGELDKKIGCVKWFNNKSGYGFITVLGEDDHFKGVDIFSHHSAIDVKGEIYKYLVQGEYVEFDILKMQGKSESTKHEHQASRIRGICSGDLMCETRHKNKDLSKLKESYNRRVHSASEE